MSGAEDAAEPVELHTANGVTHVDKCVPVQAAKLAEVVNPLLMGSCPAVLSVGRRCVEQGYSFYSNVN